MTIETVTIADRLTRLANNTDASDEARKLATDALDMLADHSADELEIFADNNDTSVMVRTELDEWLASEGYVTDTDDEDYRPADEEWGHDNLWECERTPISEWLDDAEPIVVPTTYRKVLRAGIPIRGGIGINDAEREALLDEQGLVRLIRRDGEWDAEDRAIPLAAALSGDADEWYSCVDYRIYVSGNKTQCERNRIERAISELALTLTAE